MTILEDDGSAPVPRRRSPPSFPPHQVHQPHPYSTASGPAYHALPTYPTYPLSRGPQSLDPWDAESEIGYSSSDRSYRPHVGAWDTVMGLRHQRGTKTKAVVGVALAALLYLVYDSLTRGPRRHHPDWRHGPFPPPPPPPFLDPNFPPPTGQPDNAPSDTSLGEPRVLDEAEFVQPRRPVPPTWPDPWKSVKDRSFRGRDYLSSSRFGDSTKGWKSTPDPPELTPPPAKYLFKAFEYSAAVAGTKSDGTKVRLNPGMGFDERTGRPKMVDQAVLKLGKEAGWAPLQGYKVSELGEGKLGEQKLPKVQAEMPEEDEKDERVVEERRRRDWVKRAFMHAWAGYAKYAWGHDEVSPVSSLFSNNYNGWGATLVDSLDTLLLMNLSHEYNLAREHVAAIDFTYLVPSGSKTFSTKLPALEKMDIPPPGSTVAEATEEERKKWVDPRLRQAYDQRSPTTLSWFETLIRYLGSMLSAYELSGDPLMLARATELGDWLLPSFATLHGLPQNRYTPGFNPDGMKSGRVVLAEVGSCILEMTKLSALTGNEIYYQAAQRAMDTLADRFAPVQPDSNTKAGPNYRGRLGTLLPAHIDPAFPAMLQGEYTFGGLADSYYEYLIKQAQLTSFSHDQYPRLYADAIESAYEFLIKPLEVIPGRDDLTTIGNVDWGTWKNELQHLTCFAGGMLGLGAKLLDRPHDLETGINVTNACVWVYESSATGIGGETTSFYDKDEKSRWSVQEDPKGRGQIPIGVRNANHRQIGRPETIESVFYLYRLTGDRKWQDVGWTMFVNWVEHAITEAGFGTIRNVNDNPSSRDDSQESFVLGETLKYYFLLFSPRDFMSLDDWVFSTEAHPFWIPKPGKTRSPGGFWSGPDPDRAASADFAQQLGEGTWVQKWARVQQAAELAKTARRGTAAPDSGPQGGPQVGARPPGQAQRRPFVQPPAHQVDAARQAARERVPPIDKDAPRPAAHREGGGGGGRGMAARPG
ncbi:hypothetical protein JCM8097_003346 [Rhodosporidiobolus ruineniae]